MLWAGAGRTEQSSSNMGMGASAHSQDLICTSFFLSKMTFDLGPEQLGRVLPSWPPHHGPAPPSLKGGLRVAKDLTPSASTKTDHETFSRLWLGWKLFQALEASTSLRPCQAPLVLF